MIRLSAQAGTTIVLIEERDEGFFLFEFRPNGFSADTWHQTIDRAKEQAAYEFGHALTPWAVVPPDVTDILTFLRYANGD